MRIKNVSFVLRLIVLLSLMLSACQSPSSWALSVTSSASPVGTWTVTISPDAGSTFVNSLLFSSDGTVINMENTGIVGLGVWEKLSEDTYALTFQEYFEKNDQFLHVKIISTIQLSADNEEFSGPYVVEVTDLKGTQVDADSGTATGVRQHVESVP